MTPAGAAGPRVHGSRARRGHRRHRRRTAEFLVAIVVVVVGLAYASSVAHDVVAGAAGPSPTTTPRGPDTLLALSIHGAPKPLIALIGSGGDRRPTAMAFPVGLTIVVPGEGETSTRQLARLPAASLQVGMSNAVGSWVAHYAVADLGRLATLVDRVGGLRVQLPVAVVLGTDVLGPGRVRLTGAQVAAYLGASGADTFTRWEIVLGGLLAQPPAVRQADLIKTDDLAGVQETLTGAAGAELETLPITIAAARVRIPKYSALDDLMARRFGVARSPVPVIVQNGSGVAGIGEDVARKLIPAGFRVVLSENAVTFNQQTTEVTAILDAHLAEARRARAALGVGRIGVTQVPSGIGDVLIVVGKDFSA